MVKFAPIFWLPVLLLLGGCLSDGGSSSGAGTGTGNANEPAGAASVVILPVEKLSYLPAQYEFIYSEVDQALAAGVAARGLAVVPESRVQTVLSQGLEQRLKTATSGDVEAAARELLGDLSGGTDTGWLVVPQVMVRSTQVTAPYEHVRWDGVSRDLQVHGERAGGQMLVLDTATLTVSVFNRQGQAVYFGRGGIDFLENGVRAGPQVYTSPKLAGQLGRVAVDEAVQVALGPWWQAIREAGAAGR